MLQNSGWPITRPVKSYLRTQIAHRKHYSEYYHIVLTTITDDRIVGGPKHVFYTNAGRFTLRTCSLSRCCSYFSDIVLCIVNTYAILKLVISLSILLLQRKTLIQSRLLRPQSAAQDLTPSAVNSYSSVAVACLLLPTFRCGLRA